MQPAQTFPQVLAGPIIRQANAEQVSVWMITSKKYRFLAKLFNPELHKVWFESELDNQQVSTIQVGEHAFINLLTINPVSHIDCGSRVSYDIQLIDEKQQAASITEVCAKLLYCGQSHPSFVVSKSIKRILHGSCRKPHHNSDDGLCVVDSQLQRALAGEVEPPNLLMMSGDQIYADDVAGPTLVAIKQTIEQLGLFHEELHGAVVSNSKEIFDHADCYYQRPELLPDTSATDNTYRNFFAGKRKPIFTSVNANNHLVSFAEVIAMYILTWSPEMWQIVKLSDADIPPVFQSKFAQEKVAIDKFSAGLSQVRRALAHVPVYMIFDDHDVTDDWNLTRGWEEAVYQNEFAKRIVGNALIGYWLCQGWGNKPDILQPLHTACKAHFSHHGITEHDALVDKLLA
ncbi:hypothetical protein RS130_03600 [Paraglaciecola aquimarina]|uniref:PhoD-like phosphatase metallophosphatase domain-containing protein n=1 Tax=Paraglaciecola aquimarina TaxID=1235557 RepID=A0ABU3ST11_9ALTE|nr:hypothetical protein [Paraglaciecola aquimarina]MDU0353136.1 hypothetical protein [Paraglaciecola aquimarina]